MVNRRTAISAVVGVMLWCVPAGGLEPELSVKALVAKGSAYVADYQNHLTSVVADEEYTQEILEQAPLDATMPRMRRLRSEVFFVFEPAGKQWMAIRDTILVDGRPLRDRPDVRGAFERLHAPEVGRRFAELNARWNLGRVTRNFNEPTLGLLILEPARVTRSRFDRKNVTTTADGPVVTLAFRERDRPTLIVDRSFRPVYSRGEITLDSNGRIRRTTYRVESDKVKVELTTEYGANERLGMWVPSVFRERYERRRGELEVVVCEATYTNYRRFDVVTRIK